MRREEPTRNPSSTPTTTPIAKPDMVVQKVCSACPEIGPAYCLSESRIAEGEGKMKSETLKARQMNSHKIRMAASTIHGDHFSSARCFAIRLCRFSWRLHAFLVLMAASCLPDSADVLAQLEHDVDELVGVGDLELARPRNVDHAPRQDLARTLAHHIHRVGEEGRLAQVVRHQHHGEAVARPQISQHQPQLLEIG